MDPITISLLSSGVGAAIGGFGAAAKAKEAARREQINSLLGAQDTRFSPFVAGQSRKLAETDPGPGMMGGLLSGAVAGFEQGQSLKGLGVASAGAQGMEDAALKKSYLTGFGNKKPLSLIDEDKFSFTAPQFNPYATSPVYAFNK